MAEEFKNLHEKVEDSSREDDFNDEFETMKTKKLNSLSQKIEYGDIHRNVKNLINTYTSDDCLKALYDDIVKKNTSTIQKLTRQLKKTLKTAVPETYTHQRIGILSQKDISSARLFSDGKIFKKNKEGKDINICFTLAIDESGSMQGERIERAKESAIILKEICDNLKVPVSIVGFSAMGREKAVIHNYYSDFDSPSNFKYNLVRIRAKENSRDGYTVRFLGETMSLRRPNEKNILIVISDGLPCHQIDEYIYVDKITYVPSKDAISIKDTRYQLGYIEKKCKTSIIALNISNEKYHSLMYKRVLNIENIDNLSNTLNNVLKKELLK